MNKELAKTLTLALVNYIDENRPEDTMDCSSGECVSLEKAFTEENFDSVEALINKKLSRLTEFEQALSNYLKNDFEYFHTQKWDEKKWNDVIRTQSKELIAIAREQLIKDGYIIEKKAFHDAVEKVSPEVMKDVSDNVDKKEKELTEFQDAVRVMITKALTTHTKDGNGREMSCTVFIDDDTAILLSVGLLELAKKELARRDEVITLDKLPPYDKGFQDGKAEAMADLERTYFNNPDKLPKWLKDDIARRELNAHTKGYNKGYEVATKLYSAPSFIPYSPLYQSRPLCWEPGGTCTNPQMDCINCPRRNTGGGFSTSSGTSTSKAKG